MLMGQNGAGKRTIFKLITGALRPDSGTIFVDEGATVAVSTQITPVNQRSLTVRDFFKCCIPHSHDEEVDSRIMTHFEWSSFMPHWIEPSTRSLGVSKRVSC